MAGKDRILETVTGAQLDAKITEFCSAHTKIIAKSLKRPVFLAHYLDVINTKNDRTKRKQVFFCAIESIRTVPFATVKSIAGRRNFEIRDISKCWVEYGIHIREEISGKDRKLFLISTFRT